MSRHEINAERNFDVPPRGYPTAGKSQQDNKKEREEWFENMRGSIMVVAVLVVTVTYSGGLSPPGGFWQDTSEKHTAGYPILHDNPSTHNRYQIFFYANATALMASLVIIILLMNQKFYENPLKVLILYVNMLLGLISLMIAFAAGCTRSLPTSIYVIVLAGAVLLLVVFSAKFLQEMIGAVFRDTK